MPEPSTGLVGVLGRWLEKYGINGAMFLLLAYLVWSGVEDRRIEQRTVAYSLEGISSQLTEVRDVVDSHAREGNEMIRILLAQCVNEAQDQAARDRCVGRR